MRYGYEKCEGCGVTSNRVAFPHGQGCRYGTGDEARDREIRVDAALADARPWLLVEDLVRAEAAEDRAERAHRDAVVEAFGVDNPSGGSAQ